MKIILSFLITGLMAGLLVCSAPQSGYAQTPAANAPTAAAKPDASADAAKRAKAKACSDQATAKGLHGKARHAFRAKCKRS